VVHRAGVRGGRAGRLQVAGAEPGCARGAEDLALLLVVAAGIAVRLLGVASMSLWLDEAPIANVVSRGRWAGYVVYPAANRPLGYLAVSGWHARLHDSEVVLRATSFLPAIASVALFAIVARRLLRSPGFALLATTLFAFNPWSVSLAKEFKPYAGEQCLVLLWLVLVLRWRDRPARGALVLLGATVAVAPLFAHGSLLALPPYLGLALTTCRQRGLGRETRELVACAVVALVVAAAQYGWVGSRTPPALFAGSPSWPHPSRAGVPAWSLERLLALLGDFVPLPVEPADPATLRGALLLALTAAGFVLALQRFVRRGEWWLLALVAGPLAVTWLAALVLPWPFGPERLNLFLVPLVVLAVVLGWEAAVGGRAPLVRAAFVAAALALQVPSDTIAYTGKPARFGNAREEIVPALRTIMALEADAPPSQERACLVFSRMSAYALRYYSRFHHERRAVRAFLDRHPHEIVPARTGAALGRAVRAALARCERTWVVLSHHADEELAAARDAVADPRTRFERDFVGTVVIGVGVSPPSVARAPFFG